MTRTAAFVLALFVVGGMGFMIGRSSTSSTSSAAPAPPPVIDGGPNLLPVPLVRQSTEWNCGAAAVTSVLAYWHAGTDLREADLARLMHTNEEEGTDPVNIVKTLGGIISDGGLPAPLTTDGVLANDGTTTETKNGLTIVKHDEKRGAPIFEAVLHYRATESAPSAPERARDLDDLRRALERRETVLLEVQAWREDAGTNWATDWNDGHWVVLAGLDERNVYTMDPYSFEGYTYVPIDELLARWHGEGTGKARWQHIAIYVRAKDKPPPAPSAPLLRME